MGKIVKQDRQLSTKSPPSKASAQPAKGNIAHKPQSSTNGTTHHHTHSPKHKATTAKHGAMVTNPKALPVKEVIPSKNAVHPDVVPPKPSDVARKQKINSANPGQVSSVDPTALSGSNQAEPGTVPSTKVETATTIPVKEAAATLEKRVATEMAEKDHICSSPSTEMKSKDNAHSHHSPQKEMTDVEFCWNASRANSVQLAGSFNGWQKKLDMTKEDEAWKVVIPLEKGRYTYKFIVDGEWCYDITKENECDNDGNINNILHI